MYAELTQMTSKICTKCGLEKPVERFQVNLKYKDGLHTWCKDCKLESQRKHPETNRSWVKNNQDRVKLHKDKYVNSHKEEVRASKDKWNRLNPKAILAKTRRYQADKINATPPWLTEEQKEEILRIYKTCPPGYEVDHKVPLRGKNVKGWHVPWNLQHLPVQVNRRKSNKVS